jgi:hypothetical protein
MNRWSMTRWLGVAVVGAALVVPVRGAQADTTVTTDQPFTIEVDNPCTGGHIALDGTEHIVITVTTDSSGNEHANIITHADARGTADDGVTYNLSSQDHMLSNVLSLDPVTGEPLQFTFQINQTFNGVTPGPAPNFRISSLLQVTANANGVVTAVVIQGNGGDCQGK